jgi:hypothetical protein
VRQVGAFIDDHKNNSIALSNFTSIRLDEGTMFTFGSWVCVANGSGGFNSHLANTRKPEVSASTSYRDIDKPIHNLGEFRLSDLIGNYASRFRAIPRTLIDTSNLIIGIDRVGCNIARSIKIAEAAL